MDGLIVGPHHNVGSQIPLHSIKNDQIVFIYSRKDRVFSHWLSLADCERFGGEILFLDLEKFNFSLSLDFRHKRNRLAGHRNYLSKRKKSTPHAVAANFCSTLGR